MKFIKKHKIKLIVISIFLIITLVIAIGLVKLLYPNIGLSVYGSRLDGVEKYQVNDKRLNEVKTELTKNEKIVKVSNNLTGLIVNHIITVKKDVDQITAKTIADSILEQFSDEEKNFFDFQVFVVSEDKENELFPIIGYKHHSTMNLKWTNK